MNNRNRSWFRLSGAAGTEEYGMSEISNVLTCNPITLQYNKPELEFLLLIRTSALRIQKQEKKMTEHKVTDFLKKLC